VSQVIEFGCFVEVEPGIEGLVHISEMSWSSQSEESQRLVNVGDVVDAEILEIEPERHRISLSMKKCMENPWVKFASSHHPGDFFQGKVASVTDFGLFIDIGNGVTGLVHLNDLSNEDSKKSDEEILRAYKRGQEVGVTLASIDTEKQRIALAMGEMDSSITSYIDKNPVGSDVKGVIEKVGKQSLAVTLDDGVSGFVPSGQTEEHIDEVREHYQVGAEVTGRIIGIDIKRRRVLVSIRDYVKDEERTNLENYRERQEQDEEK
jgi:small subunit ribosomal protein S1